MNLHLSNCIYRKLFFLLILLLVGTQMVLAQQDSTVDAEPKVYGNVYDGTPYYAESYESGDGSKDKPYLISNDMQLAKLATTSTTACLSPANTSSLLRTSTLALRCGLLSAHGIQRHLISLPASLTATAIR